MAQSIQTPIYRTPYIPERKKWNNLYPDYVKIVSSPIRPGMMKVFKTVLFAEQRGGKSWTQSKLAEDIVTWHTAQDLCPYRGCNARMVKRKNASKHRVSEYVYVCTKCGRRIYPAEVGVYVSQDFVALFEQLGKTPVSILILDDPLKKYLSRGGTDKGQKDAIGEFFEVAHISEEKLDKLGSKDKKSGIVYIIIGSQDITLLDRAFRKAHMIIFKTLVGNDKMTLQLLRNEHIYFNKLCHIDKMINPPHEMIHYRKWNICNINGDVGYLKLDVPKTIFCDDDSKYWVTSKDERKKEATMKLFNKLARYQREIMANPDFYIFFDDYKIGDLKAKIWHWLLWEKSEPIEFVQKYQDDILKLVRISVKKLKDEMAVEDEKEFTQEEEFEGHIIEGDIYEYIVRVIQANKRYWSNSTQKRLALKVLEKYMSAWSSGDMITQEDVGEALGVSQKTISRVWKRTNKKKDQTIMNFLCGVYGGKIFENYYTYHMRNKLSGVTVFAEVGNIHEPDYIDSRGNVRSLKFALSNPNVSSGRSYSFKIDENCIPERNACLNGQDKRGHHANKTFRLVFCDISWGNHYIETDELDPRLVERVSFRYPNKYLVFYRPEYMHMKRAEADGKIVALNSKEVMNIMDAPSKGAGAGGYVSKEEQYEICNGCPNFETKMNRKQTTWYHCKLHQKGCWDVCRTCEISPNR